MGYAAHDIAPTVDDEWTHDDMNTWLGNVNINREQPNMVPAFTKEGFVKRTMPDGLFERIDAWLSVNKDQSRHREGAVQGYINNRGKSPTYMIYLPSDILASIQAAMMPIFHDWIGGARKLQHTSTYGVRQYTNGSVLHVHVDVVQTHAVSAILNVGQEGMQEPWALAIADHAGKVHEVTMEPGEMILYESAKLIHGRPVAMNGKGYYNVFVHSAPRKGYDYQDWREDPVYKKAAKGGEL
eukprot:g5428.t1